MITAEGKLQVFEEFRIDPELPKWKRKEQLRRNATGINVHDPENLDLTEDENMSEDTFRRRFTVTSNVIQSWDPTVNNGGLGIRLVPIQPPDPWWVKFAFWRRKPKAEMPSLSIEDFFASVKNTVQELKIVTERAQGYEKAMINARKAGQQALFEQLSAGLNANRMESQLLAIGLPKYIVEADIVTFYKKCKRGLRLDWVRNFTRTIPQNILDTKERADTLGIFDNYVVLHYDPEAKAYAETNQEKEARKDPILFGLMQGRRILYFVGDWIDEFCDLTLDQIADTVGKGAIKQLGPAPLPHPYRERPELGA